MAQTHFYSAAGGQLLTAPTLSDTVDLPQPGRGLLVLAAGDVKFDALAPGVDGTVETFTMTSATVGTVIPTIVTRVWSTGTAATVGVLI